MKSVLISIQPKWCELIANGKKTVEVRKTKPKLETPFKVYIYATKSGDRLVLKSDNVFEISRAITGKVIGEFVCDKVIEFENSMYEPAFHETSVLSCVDFEKLALYLGKSDFGYGWHISNLVIYDKPRELREFKTLPCEKPESACGNCKYLEVTNTPNTYEVECYREDGIYLTRPPQSWCYVED